MTTTESPEPEPVETAIVGGQASIKTRFTSDNAAAMARRGHEKTRSKREAERADAKTRNVVIKAAAELLPTGQLVELAELTVGTMLARLISGEIPTTDAKQAASVISAAIEVRQLLSGGATSHALTLTGDDVAKRLAEIRAVAVSVATPAATVITVANDTAGGPGQVASPDSDALAETG